MEQHTWELVCLPWVWPASLSRNSLLDMGCCSNKRRARKGHQRGRVSIQKPQHLLWKFCHLERKCFPIQIHGFVTDNHPLLGWVGPGWVCTAVIVYAQGEGDLEQAVHFPLPLQVLHLPISVWDVCPWLAHRTCQRLSPSGHFQVGGVLKCLPGMSAVCFRNAWKSFSHFHNWFKD